MSSLNNIIDFFNINWVSNIWTGLIASAIVGILKLFFGKRKYKQKIIEANKEILTILESCIAENEYPKPFVLLCLHKSISKKYDTKVKDMDTFEELINELVRKVMASKFLSYQDKLNHSDRLIKLMSEINKFYLKAPVVSEINNTGQNNILLKEGTASESLYEPTSITKDNTHSNSFIEILYAKIQGLSRVLYKRLSFMLPIMAVVTIVNMLYTGFLEENKNVKVVDLPFTWSSLPDSFQFFIATSSFIGIFALSYLISSWIRSNTNKEN